MPSTELRMIIDRFYIDFFNGDCYLVRCTNFQVIGYLLDFWWAKSSKYMYTLYMYLLDFYDGDGDGDDEEQN